MREKIHFLNAAALVALLIPLTAFAGTQQSGPFNHLFEADGGSGMIFEITPQGGVATPFATGLSGPAGLAFDTSGNLFEADESSNTILKFAPDGTRTTFASGLNAPRGLAFDGSGNLFASDSGSGMIFKFTPAGNKSTFASGLSGPAGLAFDPSGNLYEADFQSGTIFKFTPGGTKTTFASGLNKPTGLTFSGSGQIVYEADSGSGKIFQFDLTGNNQGAVMTGLNKPLGLVFDFLGQLLEADGGSGTIFNLSSFVGPQALATGFNAPEGLAFAPPPGQLLNISTRLGVLTGNSVLIAGFIISDTKQVLARALGPTLSQFGVAGVLADPTLELHDGSSNLLDSNDNWKDTNQAAITATGLAPPNNAESAILSNLTSGNYTAIVRGKNSTTGVALVEIYDVDKSPTATITNISTRGFVSTNSSVMIGGFICGNGSGRVTIIVRALGPTLAQFNVPNVLADPTLELRDGNGSLIASNDNWQDTQKAEIEASGYAPPGATEAAIVVTRPAGNSTAIVRGKNNTTGNALVEVYTLN